jgi:hypothetical protein
MRDFSEKAHIDELSDLPSNAQLDLESERNAWLQLSAEGLDQAYGSDEPEYSKEDLNP